jgi:hypothetical protein
VIRSREAFLGADTGREKGRQLLRATLKRVSAEAAPRREDTGVWIGRIQAGREADHARFVQWLNSEAAQDIFKRRRLNEYTLLEEDGTVTVIFKAPHTGDPRILIDFLRYPGLWPEYWEFVRSGRDEEEPAPKAADNSVRVHWRREEAGTS